MEKEYRKNQAFYISKKGTSGAPGKKKLSPKNLKMSQCGNLFVTLRK